MEEVQRGNDDDVGAGLRADAWFGSVKAAVALAKIGFKAVLQKSSSKTLSKMPHVVSGLFLKQFMKESHCLQLDIATACERPYSSLLPKMQGLPKKGIHTT
jgi:hypothetical protein